MDKLGNIYERWLKGEQDIPDEAKYLPEDGICPECLRLVRNHPGVEKVLAARRLKYYDPDKHQMVIKVAVPYCICRTGRN